MVSFKIPFLFFVLCTCHPCCESQEFFFELKDSEVNEVIFIGERDIVLQCGVNSSQSEYEIKIEHNGNVIAYNNGTGTCVDYTITEVRSNDGGIYSCEAVNTTGAATMTCQKQLHLNVHDRSSPQCFRNGTTGVRYKEGDLLLMSCYCPSRAKKGCRWQKTVVNTRMGHLIASENTTTSNKTILRITVGPITEMDDATRFDCFLGSSAMERCSIGGTVNSSKDVVLNSASASSHFSILCHPANFNTKLPATALPDTFLTTPVLLVDDSSYTVILFSAIGILILLTCSLAFFIVTVICLRRSKNHNVFDKESEAIEADNSEMIYNSVYGTYGTGGYSQEFRKGDIIEYGTSSATVSDQTLRNEASHDAYETANGSGNSGEKEANHVCIGTRKNMNKRRNKSEDNYNSAAYAEVNTDIKMPSGRSKPLKDPVEIPAGQRERPNNDFSELYASVDKTGRRSNLF